MIFAILDEKSPFWSIVNTFWAIFGHFPYLTSINDSLTIELNPLLNWISRFFLNWTIFWIESWVKQYLNRILNESFFGKIKHWIESDWVSATTSTVFMEQTLQSIHNLKSFKRQNWYKKCFLSQNFLLRLFKLCILCKVCSINTISI